MTMMNDGLPLRSIITLATFVFKRKHSSAYTAYISLAYISLKVQCSCTTRIRKVISFSRIDNRLLTLCTIFLQIYMI